MDKITVIDGPAMPLRRSAVDTDQIIPAVFLKRVTKTGYEDALFSSWRQDPEFVLNDPAYAGATTLIAGPDFGIGSSREHAVWALRDYGIRAVISPRFADIFRGNSAKDGLLAAQVSQDDVELLWKLLENDPGMSLTVDLNTQTITAGSTVIDFQIDPYIRWRLLEGLDDISLTLRHAEDIEKFEQTRPSFAPTTTAV